MDRHRIVPLLFLLSALMAGACAHDRAEPERIETPALAKAANQQPAAPARIIRVTDFVSSAQLGLAGRPAGTGRPDPNQEGVGGFRCSKRHEVELTVSGNSPDVGISHERLPVEPGECVQWRVIANDDQPVAITRIRFIDTPEDPASTGKKFSKHPIRRDFCTEKKADCALFIALDDGHYHYEVEISHGTTSKVKDPEIEVACAGGPC